MLTERAEGTARSRVRGITLIEILVTLAIFVMLLFAAAPNLSAWIQGTRMRTVSETLQNGVRQAQAEALRRNRTVVFFLTNAEPAINAAAEDNGRNWGLRTLPLFVGDNAEFLRGGSLSDVADGVAIAGPAALCFNAAGQQATVVAEGCAVGVTNYDISRAGADRRLRIVVALGGRVRMCDPDKVLSANHPDGC